jgi:hypothetical protein
MLPKYSVNPFNDNYYIVNSIDENSFFENCRTLLVPKINFDKIIQGAVESSKKSNLKIAKTQADFEQVRNNLQETLLTIPAN